MCVRSKEGNQVYIQWCELWSREANTPPNLKMFFVDQFMSYWVREFFHFTFVVSDYSYCRFNVCCPSVENGGDYPDMWNFMLSTCLPLPAPTVMLLKIL